MGSQLTKCELHGLHYDSARHQGCVVCRRSSSLPPVPSSPPSAEPAWGNASQPAPMALVATPARSIDLWTLARFALGVAFVVALSRIFVTPESPLFGLRFVVMASASLFVVSLPVAVFRALRSWRAISWAFVSLTISIAVLAQLGHIAQAALQTTPEHSMKSVTSHRASVTIRVPESWHPTKNDPSMGFELSSEGGCAIALSEEMAIDFVETYSPEDFLRTVQKHWTSSVQGEIGEATSDSSIAGLPGIKASFSGSFGGRRQEGMILVTRSRYYFLAFVVSAPPSQADELEAALRFVEQAKVND